MHKDIKVDDTINTQNTTLQSLYPRHRAVSQFLSGGIQTVRFEVPQAQGSDKQPHRPIWKVS